MAGCHIRSSRLPQFKLTDYPLHQTLKVSLVMAAGVPDRFWEILDVVDMVDAFEAKRKHAAKPIFEVEQWKIGGENHVRATLPDGGLLG